MDKTKKPTVSSEEISAFKDKYPELFRTFSEVLNEETLALAVREYELLSKEELYILITTTAVQLSALNSMANVIEMLTDGNLPVADGGDGIPKA